MKALVTGADGFIGKHLCSSLEHRGFEVISLERSYLDAVDPNFSSDSLTTYLSEIKPDLVFHLAGLTNASQAFLFYQANVTTTAHLLSSLERAGFHEIPILLAGSAAEYGNLSEAELPAQEDGPTRPSSPYGISKLLQSQLARHYFDRPFKKLVVARIFNIMGPGMSDRMVPMTFVSQLQALKAQGGGVLRTLSLNPERDFADVQNVCDALIEIVMSPHLTSQIINVCTGHGIKIRQLADELIDLMDLTGKISLAEETSLGQGISKSYGDSRRLLALTGKALEFDLSYSLKRLLTAGAH